MSARIDQEEQAALKAIRDAIINPGPIKHIKTGKAMSLNPVYMMVPGRKEGEIAPEKDYSGLPVIDRAKAMKDKAEKTEKAVARVKAKSKVEKEKLEAMRFRLEGEVDHAPSWARVIQGQVWEVPDSDSEDDLGAEQEKKYDREGNEIIANPGWRAKVVSQINDDWINQAVSPIRTLQDDNMAYSTGSQKGLSRFHSRAARSTPRPCCEFKFSV